MSYFNMGIIIGSLFTWVITHRFFNVGPKLEYKWACEESGCLFEIATDNPDPEAMMMVIDDHKETHI